MSKFYVTTAINYPNGKPHLGHAYESLLADVLARYHRQHGDDVFFTTGMDEHGQKIQNAADNAGKDPQQYVDEIVIYFQEFYQKFGISLDHLVRTTDKEHKKASIKLWKACAKDIYRSSYTGPYCVGCERFYTEKELIDGACPDHKIKLEVITEDNYFFKLSNYTSQIKELIVSDKLRIVPATRKNEILALVESGLDDVSISRSKEKLKWGIDVPEDTSQVMYVWFDALANYLSNVGYGSDESRFGEWWPANIHVIGKDILRFHAALWPAMLMSAGLLLPQKVLVHGFINIDGQKMGKSLGNTVDPLAIINRYGADSLRYFLLRELALGADGDFNIDRFEMIYNTDLANELGNLVQRVAVMITKYQDGAVGEVPNHSHDMKAFHEAVTSLKFDRALEEIWQEIKGLNQLIEEEKPWELAKSDPTHLSEVLAHAVADLNQIATLLLPFLPTAAEKIIKTFAGGKVDHSVGILFPKQDSETAETITHTNLQLPK